MSGRIRNCCSHCSTACRSSGCVAYQTHALWPHAVVGVVYDSWATIPGAEQRMCLHGMQDHAFDKIIKALYGDVDQYDAEVGSKLWHCQMCRQ